MTINKFSYIMRRTNFFPSTFAAFSVISFCIPSAMIFLMAVFSTSSRISSFSRKSSNVLPMCLFISLERIKFDTKSLAKRIRLTLC